MNHDTVYTSQISTPFGAFLFVTRRIVTNDAEVFSVSIVNNVNFTTITGAFSQYVARHNGMLPYKEVFANIRMNFPYLDDKIEQKLCQDLNLTPKEFIY